jgi:hypothetical protein
VVTKARNGNFPTLKRKVVPVLSSLRSGGIAPLFLTSALDGGEWSASRPCHFTPGKELDPQSLQLCVHFNIIPRHHEILTVLYVILQQCPLLLCLRALSVPYYVGFAVPSSYRIWTSPSAVYFHTKSIHSMTGSVAVVQNTFLEPAPPHLLQRFCVRCTLVCFSRSYRNVPSCLHVRNR